MPITYPAPPPSISGDTISIDRFLQQPTYFERALRTIAQNRFIGDVLLSGRGQATGGAVIYEQNESIFTDRPVESVEPLSAFPLTTVGAGPALIAAVKKWGQDTMVSDESIKRRIGNPVGRATQKIANTVIRQVDTVALAAIASAVTQTMAVATAWATSTKILRDILTAKATITALNQGYDPDVAVVDDLTFAIIASDVTLATYARREDPGNPIYTGNFPVVGGLRILPTSNIPVAGRALVADSKVLGSMVDEEPLSGKSMRDEEAEGWRLRGKRITVPIVQEPAAAIWLTGI